MEDIVEAVEKRFENCTLNKASNGPMNILPKAKVKRADDKVTRKKSAPSAVPTLTSEEVNDKSEETNEDQSGFSKNKSNDKSETQEVNKLKRDIITLRAEIKARSDKIEKNDEKMKTLRTNIIKHLQQSLSDPLFETSSMSLLVTQLSMTLTEDEIGECGM